MQYGATDETYTKTRILSIDHTERQFTQAATIVLSNHDDAFGTTSFLGFKVTISYGLTTSAGDEYDGLSSGPGGQSAPLYVFDQVFHSSPGRLTLTLYCKGLPDLMAEDRASQQYIQDSANTLTIKDFLTSVTVLSGVLFRIYWRSKSLTATFASEDQLLDNHVPADAFFIPLNRSRLAVIQDLLFFCKTVFRAEDDGEIHYLVPKSEGLPWAVTTAYEVNDYVKPSNSVYYLNWAFQCTTAGTSHATTEPTWTASDGGTTSDGTVTWTTREFDYTYESLQLASGIHEMYAWNDIRKLPMPNRIVVSSHPNSGDTYEGAAEDTDASDLTDMEKTEYHYVRAASNAECVRIAEAILENYRRDGQTGVVTVPMNIGQEVHDYIECTDYRHGSADRLRGNIGTLRRVVGGGNWYMEISFGKSQSQGLLGMLSEQSSLILYEQPEGGIGGGLATWTAPIIQPDAVDANQQIVDAITELAEFTDADITDLRNKLIPILNNYDLRFQLLTGQTLLLQEQVGLLEQQINELWRWLNATIAAQGKETIATIEAVATMKAPVGTDKYTL